MIWSKNQILDRDDFKLACVSKTAEIIYNAFGDDYMDQKVAARNEYSARFKRINFSVDKNSDGALSVYEQKTKVGYFSR